MDQNTNQIGQKVDQTNQLRKSVLQIGENLATQSSKISKKSIKSQSDFAWAVRSAESRFCLGKNILFERRWKVRISFKICYLLLEVFPDLIHWNKWLECKNLKEKVKKNTTLELIDENLWCPTTVNVQIKNRTVLAQTINFRLDTSQGRRKL